MELLVILLVLVLLVALLIPRLGRVREVAKAEACRKNLMLNNLAFRLWCGDSTGAYPAARSTNNGGTMELCVSGVAFVHFRAMSNELADVKLLVCPADRERVAATSFARNFSDANVSYFVGLDATADDPTSFLSGDRNLATNSHRLPPGLFVMSTNSLLTWASDFHRSRGNIAFADGSVQFLDQAGLLKAVRNLAFATNRLATP